MARGGAVALMPLLLLPSAAMGESEDTAAVAAVLLKLDEAYAARDAGAAANLFSPAPDVVFYGPDLTDRWTGVGAIRSGLNVEFKRFTSIAVEAQSPRIHVRGQVAWFERMIVLNVIERSHGENSRLIRATGVLEKAPSGWRLVQVHHAVGLSRELSSGGGP